MNKKALSLAISIALAIPTITNALSLGDIESDSSLNQPFRGKINLHSTSVAEAKTLQVRVAPKAVFDRVGIDRPAFLNSIRFRTTVQNGKPVILVSSNQAINEPFLNFLLEVSWPNGQLLKEYTVLLDPPVLMRADTAIASNNAGVRAEPQAGRIVRPAARAPQMTQQQRLAQQRRQAQAQRQALAQRQAQAQRQTQQAKAAPRARTADEIFAETARRILAQGSTQQVAQQTRRARQPVRSTGRTYRVKRGDTLSKIAQRVALRGVRSEQMMVALFEKNRGAFANNNMNILKSGVVLKRPSLQEAKSVTRKQARAQIAAQARDWKVARGQAVASKGSKPATKLATKVASNQQARMTVAGTNGSVDAGNTTIAALNKKLTAVNEALTSKLKENEELQSRVTELESLLRKKNRLITLKKEQLAKLQASAGITPEVEKGVQVEPEVAPIPEAIAPVVPETGRPEANTTEEQIAPELLDDTDMKQEMANELSTDNNIIARDDTAETIAPVTEAVAEGEDGGILGMLTSPTVLGSAAGLGALGLVGFGLMRRRRKEDDFDGVEEFGSIDIDTQMDDDISPFSDETTSTSIIDETEFTSNDVPVTKVTDVNAHEGDETSDDIIQEADVYIVYGLHDQAESELKQAIEKDPNNMAFRAKLLENYKAAGDVESFEAEAKVFMSMDSADKDQYLDDIKSWGDTLNPANNLFSGATAAVATAGAAGVAMVAGTAEATTDAINNTVENSADTLGDVISDDSDLIDNIDEVALDLGNDTTINTGVEFDEITNDLESEMGSVDDLLDMDDNTEVSDALDIDLNFDTGIDDSLDVANLNLDIDANEFDKIMPEDHAYKSTGEDGAKEEAENILADAEDNLSFLDLDDDAEVIEETQVDTKLDLAKAYIDMGDIEGARSTLEEVMMDGSDDQKREAEELLRNTG